MGSANPYILGKRVRARREGSGYSLRELARRAEVAPETVRAVERGTVSPSIATAEKIASGLDTELRALLPGRTETATTNRRGPSKRIMLRAKDSGIVTEADGTRFKVIAGQTHLAPDHRIFKSNPDLRRHFEAVDEVAEMRAASKRQEQRRLGERKPRRPKRRTPGGRYRIPKREES
jgi:transcriptional regulator with XRE-family HTH domain